MTPRTFLAPRAQRGLTIVELLISVTLGLLILGAVLYVYLGSKGSYRISKSTSRIQEAGRFGLDAMLRDVRNVSFIGCGSRVSAAAPTVPQNIYQIANPPLSLNTSAGALFGYMATNYAQGAPLTSGNWTPPGLLVPRTAGDVLVMRIAMGAPLMMAKDPDPTIPAIFLANNCANVAQGNYLLVSNCQSATILRVSNVPMTGASACPKGSVVVPGGVQFDHGGGTDANGNPYNGFPAGNPPGPGTSLTYPGQPAMTAASLATAQQFDEVSYYVGTFPGRPAPALYRYSKAAGSPEEIIDHVENMVVLYGVNNAGVVACQNADQVSAANNWSQVVSVRISLITVADEQGTVDTPQSFNLGFCDPSLPSITVPAVTGNTSQNLREVFTATAALRDRLQ